MSVKIIDTLKPKSNGSFPIVEAVDVSVSEDLRLPEALAAKADATDLAETNAAVALKADASALSETNAAVASKANASDVATATAELQGEIDQIVISAAAESVVAPEVAAARVDAEGVSYQTLKDRLDAGDSKYSIDIEKIDARLDDVIETTLYPLTESDFGYGLINQDGSTIITENTPLHNIFSKIVNANGVTIVPNSDDTIFKVAYYTASGTFISQTSWMGRTAYTIVGSYTIDGEYCRIAIANANESVSTSTISGHLAKYKFIQSETAKSVEVEAARVGVSGTHYANLEERLNSENSELFEGLTEAEKTLSSIADVSRFALTENDCKWGLINQDGSTIITENTPLHNVFSDIVSADGVKITPISDDVIFKVAYYTSNGTYIDQTVWMGKTAYTIVDDYTIDGEYCRIAIADPNAEVGTDTIAEQISKLRFDGGDTSVTIKEEALPDNSPIQIPFQTEIEFTLYHRNGQYFVEVPDTHIKKENGVVAYISPTGSHENDGLTILTPVKTLDEALSIANVETIIFLEGTYEVGTHFTAGNDVDISVNIIGIGNVIIDNGEGLNNNPINFTETCYVRNIHFMHGNNTVKATLSATKTITFEDCIFSKSDRLQFSNGAAILGGKAYMINCTAYDNAYDGFNYHANGTVINHALEYNCKSYNNGNTDLTVDSGQSSNATTSHDGSRIIRVNGDYYACHGGIVADLQCKSANYGCSSGISTITDSNYPDRMSNYWSSAAEMYLYDCKSYGSKYDTAIVNSGRIISNVTYSSNYPPQNS